MAKRIACGPLSEQTEESLRFGRTLHGTMLDFVRANDLAVFLQDKTASQERTIADLRARIATLEAEKWQPIETAPKDDRYILLWVPVTFKKHGTPIEQFLRHCERRPSGAAS